MFAFYHICILLLLLSNTYNTLLQINILLLYFNLYLENEAGGALIDVIYAFCSDLYLFILQRRFQ